MTPADIFALATATIVVAVGIWVVFPIWVPWAPRDGARHRIMMDGNGDFWVEELRTVFFVRRWWRLRGGEKFLTRHDACQWRNDHLRWERTAKRRAALAKERFDTGECR
jgi:hypothetical protein